MALFLLQAPSMRRLLVSAGVCLRPFLLVSSFRHFCCILWSNCFIPWVLTDFSQCFIQTVILKSEGIATTPSPSCTNSCPSFDINWNVSGIPDMYLMQLLHQKPVNMIWHAGRNLRWWGLANKFIIWGTLFLIGEFCEGAYLMWSLFFFCDERLQRTRIYEQHWCAMDGWKCVQNLNSLHELWRKTQLLNSVLFSTYQQMDGRHQILEFGIYYLSYFWFTNKNFNSRSSARLFPW